MNNELKILPLRKYTVSVYDYRDLEGANKEETFTADHYNVVADSGIIRVIFYRTGNVIREYLGGVNKILVTPVDAEEIPA